MEQWLQWEQELINLNDTVQMPQCYVPSAADSPETQCDLNIYCDASE